MSITVESLAATVTVGAINTPPMVTVKVPAVPAVFVATISVITVVVDAGTV
jgi:hypothetical protein